MADNALIAGVPSIGAPSYPQYQPMQQVNPLAQVQAAQGLALQQQALQSQQFQIGKQRLDYLHDQMGSIAALPNPSFQDVTNVATNLVRMGYPPDQVSAELANAPKDPAGIKAWATQHMAGIANHAQRLEMGYGAPGQMNLGDVQQPTMRNVTSGVVTPTGPSFAQGTTPGEKMAPQRAIVGGIPVDIPNASRFDRAGNPLPTPTAPQAGAGAATNMAPRGMALPAGTVQAGQGPGVETTANAQAVANQQRAAALQEAASRAPDTKAILDRMDANAATFTGGPASPLLKKAGGYINQFAGYGGLEPPIASQAAREAFDKDSALLAGQQSSVLGNTDAAKTLASVMTPGSTNTNEGIRNIAAVLKGNQDAIQAKAQAWDQYRSAMPTGQADYGHFETNFNKTFSPRAFAMTYMSPAERQKMWNSMSSTEQKQVQTAYDEAKAKGYIKSPGSAAPSPPNGQ